MSGRPCGQNPCSKIHGWPFQDFVVCAKYIDANKCPHSARQCYFLHPDSIWDDERQIRRPRERTQKWKHTKKRPHPNMADREERKKKIKLTTQTEKSDKDKTSEICNVKGTGKGKNSDIINVQSKTKLVTSMKNLKLGSNIEIQKEAENLPSTSKKTPPIIKLPTGPLTTKPKCHVRPQIHKTRPLARLDQTSGFVPLEVEDELQIIYDDYRSTRTHSE